MRKPRDYDAELKALEDKARELKTRKVQQLGELVIATGADALTAEELAGALVARSRAATDDELAAIPWLVLLDDVERQRVLADLRVVQAQRGETICRVGRPVTFWFVRSVMVRKL